MWKLFSLLLSFYLLLLPEALCEVELQGSTSVANHGGQVSFSLEVIGTSDLYLKGIWTRHRPGQGSTLKGQVMMYPSFGSTCGEAKLPYTFTPLKTSLFSIAADDGNLYPLTADAGWTLAAGETYCFVDGRLSGAGAAPACELAGSKFDIFGNDSYVSLKAGHRLKSNWDDDYSPAPCRWSGKISYVILDAPTISTQPSPSTQTKLTGDSFSISITATGTPTPTYQWKKDGVDISGATSATFSIGSLVLADEATYTCDVTNTHATLTSSSVVLTMEAAPTITAPFRRR